MLRHMSLRQNSLSLLAEVLRSLFLQPFLHVHEPISVFGAVVITGNRNETY